MAESLAEGGGPRAASRLKEADAATLDDLVAADGLALGSPVHMGAWTGGSRSSSTRCAARPG
jgi:multimeric flavodoxin WrbA